MAGNVGDVMAVVFKKKSAHKKKSYSLLNGLFFEPFISYTLSNFGSPLATAMILSSSSSPSIIWIIPFYYRKSPPNYHFKMILFLSFLPTNNSSIDECQGRYFLTAENKNIKRISISSHSLWNEPIMRRIMHGSVKNSIEFDQSRTIDFKLSTRSFWDFNQRCHILRCVATWGDVIRRVCHSIFLSFSFFSKNPIKKSTNNFVSPIIVYVQRICHETFVILKYCTWVCLFYKGESYSFELKVYSRNTCVLMGLTRDNWIIYNSDHYENKRRKKGREGVANNFKENRY